MSHLLTVTGLEVFAGDRALVQGIDLAVRPGEFLAIVGESGSGKSVTAMACCGLLPPELKARGGIRFAEHELAGLSPARWRALRRNGIAAIFQDPMSSLNPLMKVSAQLAEAIDGRPRLDGGKAATVRQLLREVGLTDTDRILEAYPYELSGGQQQRVMIATALATGPRLLIADEPTTALDASTQHQVIQLLQRLRVERGLAVLMVTHDLSIVRSVADRIAVFRGGRCVEQGEAQAVMGEPRHAYTRMLVEASTERLSRAAGAPAGAGARTVVVARDMSYRYPGADRQALDRVELTVREGECLGIVGASGSGKSTLAKVLVGAMQADAGHVEVCGLPASGRWRSTRDNLAFARRCQYVFQDTTGSLNPSHHVERILRDALKLAGRADAPGAGPAQLLAEVGLAAELLARRPADLSGGQRQRVVIARALAMHPGVLVCDEPVSALDAHLQKQVVKLLIGLQRARGMALVFIGHDLDLMGQFCDRLVVMDAGRVVEHGPTAEVLRASRSHAMRELVTHAFAQRRGEDGPRVPQAEAAHDEAPSAWADPQRWLRLRAGRFSAAAVASRG